MGKTRKSVLQVWGSPTTDGQSSSPHDNVDTDATFLPITEENIQLLKSRNRSSSSTRLEKWKGTLTGRDRAQMANDMILDIQHKLEADVDDRKNTMKTIGTIDRMELVISYFEQKLEEKDADLVMAAEIGKALLDEQQELDQTNQLLQQANAQLATKNENLEMQLSHLRSTLQNANERNSSMVQEIAELTAVVQSVTDQARLQELSHATATPTKHNKSRNQSFDRTKDALNQKIDESQREITLLKEHCQILEAETVRFANALALATQLQVLGEMVAGENLMKLQKRVKKEVEVLREKLDETTCERDDIAAQFKEELASSKENRAVPPESPHQRGHGALHFTSFQSRSVASPMNLPANPPNTWIGEDNSDKATGLSIVAEIEQRLRGGEHEYSDLAAGEEFFMMTIACIKYKSPELSLVQIDCPALFSEFRVRGVPFIEWETNICQALQRELNLHPPERPWLKFKNSIAKRTKA
eukprot:c4444_g1_i2.p1 GENE.c4444_g1_i2~~c4444_g1_i2.p1  ORF type:complete len:487 (+),score=103.42 c4444_g1_i2:43-1461(+)